MAQRIINEMNRTTDAGLMKVWRNALNELGVRYMFDEYTNEWMLTNGYTKSELARMKGGAR